MGYTIMKKNMAAIIQALQQEHIIYAPILDAGGGRFSDTDIVRYGAIQNFEDIVFDQKSDYSFKEVLLPISQTLFFFTEDAVKEAGGPQKNAIVFLRSCDLHALNRLDDIYLKNGCEDYYYKQLRKNTKWVLMGCQTSFENCFCPSMQTNRTQHYDCSVEIKDGLVYIDNRTAEWDPLFTQHCQEQKEVTPSYIKEGVQPVAVPQSLPDDIVAHPLWDEYDGRCINCGRCNFVCPTCTCFSMQDIFYTDNGKAGERRRVWASCMVDGFTDMAGNIAFRQKNGQRMRFRVLHKISDYKKRTGRHMCVGCGRCDNICPEYISFIHCIQNLNRIVEEAGRHV